MVPEERALGSDYERLGRQSFSPGGSLLKMKIGSKSGIVLWYTTREDLSSAGILPFLPRSPTRVAKR
jgi:hypothetical protein